MEIFQIILFIPLLFLFSLFFAFTIRKRIIEKIMFTPPQTLYSRLRVQFFILLIIVVLKKFVMLYKP
ncbi:hypothetical protein RN93_11845 (plasmid) [Fusobacterium polymorphum]|uniref:Uncharacterized protein n=1 Tax=Fusobacterium nucleatum subsp. polymorphum TaxID=76857 RepID=A0AAC8ZZP5_FUSNP|nr:hypothetical protein RO02_04280 [Fusobacterium polymorphum]ALQ43488.1 hypothetical protein RN93_11845 [Fusobacterium polymorphum]